MKIKFCGAASGVTGSCHLITTEDYKILLDCGQFQGGKTIEAMNYEDFPFNPGEVDVMVLSHAHIDHCGRIPLLVKRGFKGKIYCTDATADLAEIMLKDSAYIQEKEAEQRNRKGERAGRAPVEPLYTVEDAIYSLKYITPVLYDQLIEINEHVKVVFNDAGHILGSAEVELWIEEKGNVSKLVFSGDLGVMDRPILRNPTIIKSADFVIMEATYGNRLHPANATSIEGLMDIVVKTVKRGGNVVIPSFAVGRTQELLYQFNKFYEKHEELKGVLEDVMVYVDSPMAGAATEVFTKNAQVFDDETKADILSGDNPLEFKNLQFTKTSDESRALNFDKKPKIIISASGMCEAGRIRHHLKHNLWGASNSIVFVGYQAEGTLGRLLVNGTEEVTLFGEQIRVNAEIHNLEGFSGHADRDGLLGWLKGFTKRMPKEVFIVHGESDSKHEFAKTVKEILGLDCTVVDGVSEFELVSDGIINRQEAIKEALDDEAITGLKVKIGTIHDNMESLLYRARLAVDENSSEEKARNVNNMILELEKATVNLGTALSE